MQRSSQSRPKLNAILCALFVTAAVSASAMEGDPTLGEKRTLAAREDAPMPTQWRPRAAQSLLPKGPSQLLQGLKKLRQLSKVEQYLEEQRSQEQVAADKTKAPSSPGSWLVQPKALGLGALSAAVIGAGLWWRHKRAKEKASAAILELRRNTLVNNPEEADRPAQPDATAPVDVDLVECSVYGPRAARPGAPIMIQVFLHLPEQREQASFLAEAMDSSATSRSIQTLEIDVRRGARVEISLAAGALSVDEPVQSVIWRGRTVFRQFLVDIPEGTSGQNFFLVVRVRVDGSLIGLIKFRISSDQKATNLEPVILGDYARRYKKAFVSYATIDREEVLKRVQIMRLLELKYFQDVLTLEPGDRWEKKLYEYIDRCDLFLLFWSQAAKDSQYVQKEIEYAYNHQQESPAREPDIMPLALEQGVEPPPILAHLHFNDQIGLMIDLMKGAKASQTAANASAQEP